MTIKEALNQAIAQFTGTVSPRLDAQILLAEVLRVDKSYLSAHDNDELLPDAEAAFGELVARRAAGEPIAYILGTKGFWDLNFVVSPAVLIPRPETEHLIEVALEWAKGKTGLVAADIGTGSGAIAVTVAKHAPNVTTHAVDISPDALAIARKNAEMQGVGIQFHEGSLASPLIAEGVKVDMLLANLPYIRSDEVLELIVTDYEPILALNGGEDGLDLVRELLLQVPQICRPNALILLEIGMKQGQAVMEFAQKLLSPKEVSVIKDLAGLDRVVKIVMGVDSSQ